MSKINISDQLNNLDLSSLQTKTFRTRVIGGYDPYIDKKSGITKFGEVVFDKPNMVVLGGAEYVLERVFNVQAGLKVAYLEDIIPGVKLSTEPEITGYPTGHTVCLFGVGIGGCGDSMTDVIPTYYYEREIVDMIPLRQTASALSTSDATKYFFKKAVTVNGTSKTAYYLKKFESDPQIKVLWDDGEGDEDGSEVGENVYETSSSVTTGIETFIELVLKISKNDVREYFVDNGNVDQTRINSIGLFTGVPVTVATGVTDYRAVRLFSKININNEMLTLNKDLTISYRIYTK